MAHRGDDYFHDVPANPANHLENLDAIPLNPNVAQIADSVFVSEGVKRRRFQNKATDADVVTSEERRFESVRRRLEAAAAPAPHAVGIAQQVVDLLTGPQGPLTALQNQVNNRLDGLQNQVNGLQNQVNNRLDGLQNQVNGLQNQVNGLQNQVNDLIDIGIETWNESELARARLHNSTQQAQLMFPRRRIQGQNQNQPIHCPVVVATVIQLQDLSGQNLNQILVFYFSQNFNIPIRLEARRLLIMKHLGIVSGPAA